MLILLVEDEANIRSTLEQVLSRDHQVVACEDGPAALTQLKKRSFDLVVTDNQMPGMTGLELMAEGKAISPSTSFFLMTAYGNVNQAVEAIRSGAEDYILKPFELDDIKHRVQRIAELRSFFREKQLKQENAKHGRFLIGQSSAIRAAHEFISQVSPVHSPVIIFGPTGTGKELVARAIHDSGPRAMKPFVAINCASLSEPLMESELFGHEKGAFTGATAAKAGKFELAAEGTLFLDEIGELSPGIQAKLLRVLQEKEYYRVGGTRLLRTDARIVAATHRDLPAMCREGSFRDDLYFRLNVVSLQLPALSERAEDIAPLIHHLLEQLASEFGRKVKLSESTLQFLTSYHYPGNVRELRNLLERLLVLSPSGGVIGPEKLPAEVRGEAAKGSIGAPRSTDKRNLVEAVEELERRLITRALKEARGNQARAAEALGISRGQLIRKIKRYNLEDWPELPKEEAA